MSSLDRIASEATLAAARYQLSAEQAADLEMMIRRIVEAEVADEREACAVACEELERRDFERERRTNLHCYCRTFAQLECVDIIRARGKNSGATPTDR